MLLASSKWYVRPVLAISSAEAVRPCRIDPASGRRVFTAADGRQLDSRWVVPHHLWLCQMFDCHINVKICAPIHAVKYVYKYIYKGHDRVQAQLCRRGER